MISLTLYPRKGKTIGVENKLVVPRDQSGDRASIFEGENTTVKPDCGGGNMTLLTLQNKVCLNGELIVYQLYHHNPYQK